MFYWATTNKLYLNRRPKKVKTQTDIALQSEETFKMVKSFHYLLWWVTALWKAVVGWEKKSWTTQTTFVFAFTSNYFKGLLKYSWINLGEVGASGRGVGGWGWGEPKAQTVLKLMISLKKRHEIHHLTNKHPFQNSALWQHVAVQYVLIQNDIAHQKMWPQSAYFC